MAQNVTVAGAAYKSVPAIDLPKTGGGTARFYDTQGDKALTPGLTAQNSVDVKSYATVSVAAVTKELLAKLDSDFVAENIKKDVDLFGLIGTLEAGGGNISTGEITMAGNVEITVTHGLGIRPNTIAVVMKPTGVEDKLCPISQMCVSKYNVGSIKVGGSGFNGENYSGLYCVFESSNTTKERWDGDIVTSSYIGKVTDQTFELGFGYGMRSFLWFAIA